MCPNVLYRDLDGLRLDWASEMKRLPPGRLLPCLLLVAYDLPGYLTCVFCHGLRRGRQGLYPTYCQNELYSCY